MLCVNVPAFLEGRRRKPDAACPEPGVYSSVRGFPSLLTYNATYLFNALLGNSSVNTFS
jgi:hypothetical protein